MPNQSPLHLAVLHDDLAAIKLLQHNPDLITRKNWLGFTPYELAIMLGKREIAMLLSPRIDPPIKIQKEGESAPGYYNRAQFEAFFKVRYLEAPCYSSFQQLNELVANCPWLLGYTFLGENQRALGTVLRKSLFSGKVLDVAIKWISAEMGYGLFAESQIEKGSFIGQYSGFVRRVSRFYPKLNGYCLHIPTKCCSLRYFVLDALSGGNELRFANHSDQPTMKPVCLVDRSLVHVGLFATRTIAPGEELTFNYGKDYWKYRRKI